MHDRWTTLTRDSMTVLAWRAKTLMTSCTTAEWPRKDTSSSLNAQRGVSDLSPSHLYTVACAGGKKGSMPTTSRAVTCQRFIPFVLWLNQPHFQPPFLWCCWQGSPLCSTKWLEGGQGYVSLLILVHFHEAHNIRPLLQWVMVLVLPYTTGWQYGRIGSFGLLNS